MRLGKMEKLILLNIVNFHKEENKTISKYQRFYTSPGKIPLVYVRNRIFGTAHFITPSNKASFSRALRRLEEKGLIETWNHVSERTRYSTHAWPTPRIRALTEEGERLTFTNIVEKLTSISSKVSVSRKEEADEE